MNYLLFAALLGLVTWLAIALHRAKRRGSLKSASTGAIWIAEIPSLAVYDEFPATYQDSLELLVASKEEIEDEAASYALFLLYGQDKEKVTEDLIVQVTSPVNTISRFVPDFLDDVLVGVKVAPN